VPGLADMPVAGRLFQNKDDTANKTEVVLLITPRVVRNIERSEAKLEEFNSGTESEIGGGGGSAALQSFAPASIPAAPAQPQAPAPAAQPSIPSTLGSPAPAAGPQPRQGQ